MTLMRAMMHMVMHMRKSERDATKAITVRIPESEYKVLRDYAAAQGKSLNMIVSDAVATATAGLRRRAVLSEIAAFQKKHGLRSKPTAVDDVREIRLERTRQLSPDKPEEGSQQ